MKWSHKGVKELRNFDETVKSMYYLYEGHTESRDYVYIKINVHVQKTSIMLSNRRWFAAFPQTPHSFHTIPPVVNYLEYAATLEVQCSLLQLVRRASWITIMFL
jgi:hypothetical protein